MKQGYVVPLTEATAFHGARLSISYELPIADALVLAIARMNEAVL